MYRPCRRARGTPGFACRGIGLAAAAAVLALSAPRRAAAQQEEALPLPERAPVPAAGTLLRVEYGPFGQARVAVGALARWSADSLVVRDGRGRQTGWPIALVSRVDVGRGRGKTHAYPGALVGLLAGAALGTVAGPALRDNSNCTSPQCRSPHAAMRRGAAVGLGVGIAVGAAVGTFLHGEVWQPIAARPAAP